MTVRTVSYSGAPGAWRGVVKADGVVVWTCPHTHRNRDYGREVSARQCAQAYLANPDAWERKEQARVAWVESRRGGAWA